MIRKWLGLLSVLPAVAAYSLPAAAGAAIYSTETGAQETCPAQEVVWLNLNTNKYYHKSSVNYGKSGGAYACTTAAYARGYREAKEQSQEASKPD